MSPTFKIQVTILIYEFLYFYSPSNCFPRKKTSREKQEGYGLGTFKKTDILKNWLHHYSYLEPNVCPESAIWLQAFHNDSTEKAVTKGFSGVSVCLSRAPCLEQILTPVRAVNVYDPVPNSMPKMPSEDSKVLNLGESLWFILFKVGRYLVLKVMGIFSS